MGKSCDFCLSDDVNNNKMAGTSKTMDVRPKRKSADAARRLFVSGIFDEGETSGLSSDEEGQLDQELCPSSSDSERETDVFQRPTQAKTVKTSTNLVS